MTPAPVSPSAAVEARPGWPQLSSPRMIVAMGALSVLIVALLFGVSAWRDRAQAFREAELLADDLAAVLAEHAGRLFEMGEFVLDEAVRLAGPADAPIPADERAHRRLAELAGLAPFIASIWLGDAKGDAVLTSRRYPTPRLNAADRAYYRVPRDEPDALYIGLLPDNRYTDAALINMSRRLEPVDGEFRGFAQVSVSPDYVRSLYESLRADLDTVFWLLDGRLRPLLREPRLPVERLGAAPTAEAFAPTLRGAAEGTFTATSPADGVRRLQSFRKVPDFDAFIVVGVAVDDVLARWHGRLLTYVWAGLAALLAILGLSGVAWQQAAREQAFTRSLERRVRERTAALEEALGQKDVLLREVDHRVKNSLQLVASLLTIQARDAGDPAVRGQLADAHGRVLAIARIHDRLHRSDRAEAIAFGRYLRELCRDLAASLSQGTGRRRLVVEAAEVDLPTDTVVPLALIVNELVTNAYKYAYPPDAPGGVVLVGLGRVPPAGGDGGEGRLRLFVADEGIGLPPGFDPDGSAGAGMRLVRGLARQLDGTFRAEPNDPRGTRFVVEVPAAGRG
ncbi:MAG TPA: histidine kinase dimerization/phosphoacceptor domain -containing protein [Geminicoccaceae bacterium]|nr:histidine kinase dimerization/phosphoacceptor domain -containing protein [Geminicoccaceae bacterium]